MTEIQKLRAKVEELEREVAALRLLIGTREVHHHHYPQIPAPWQPASPWEPTFPSWPIITCGSSTSTCGN